jgi:predicted phage terminase large subunit-like protein
VTTQLSPAQVAAAQELLRIDQALSGMVSFRGHLVEHNVSNDFTHAPAAHHLVVIRELERLERGDIQRLLILAPPGSAKSTYCSIQFALWYLARHPDQIILCASNTDALAESFNRRRRSVALHPEWCRLADTRLAVDQQSLARFATEKGGGCVAAGVGSSIVGLRSHLNVLDDPIRSFEEAQSATQLDKQADWWFSDFRSRLVPGGKELVVSTRWARRDIAGRIIDLAKNGDEQWTILRIPMVADSAADPVGRREGERLWPEYLSETQHVKEPMRDVRKWSAMYQQVPLDASGSWVDDTHVQYEDAAPANLKLVLAIDLALSVNQGDYTALIVAGIDSRRDIHIVEVHRARSDPEQTIEKLFQLHETYEPFEWLIDDDNASKVFMRLLYDRARARGASAPLVKLPIRGRDKETRAAAIRGYFLARQVHIVRAPWNAELHRELVNFPAGDTDDQVDALSLIGRRMAVISAPTSTKDEAPPDPFAGMLYDGRMNDVGALITRATLDELWKTLPQSSPRGRI